VYVHVVSWLVSEEDMGVCPRTEQVRETGRQGNHKWGHQQNANDKQKALWRIVYAFICGLFNDADSSSHYTEWNNFIIYDNEAEIMWKESDLA
jgi:hypothetical protein